MFHKKFDHSAALLKAAIRHGVREPWMYEALAIAQEAAGEEPEEIKRTLLSAADVTGDSPDAQYRVARMLARHGLKPAAIRLYRELSEKAPLAFQPYAESLELAASLGDVATARWAATRILSRGWVRNQEQLYKLARSWTAELETKLRAMGRIEEAGEFAQAVRQADTRDLVIRVTWHGEADLDLEVLEPLGSVCSPQNRMTPAGGVLVRDASGRDVGSEKNPAEMYVCPHGLSGRYEIRLEPIWGEPLGGRARVEVTWYEGTPKQKTESFYVAVGGAKPLVVGLYAGRRTRLLPISQVVRAPRSESEAKSPIQQLSSMIERQNGGRFRGPRGLSQFVGGVGAVARGGAVAFQPQITQFFDGPLLGVQAVVSADRRYVRISAFPSFNTIIGERRFTTSGAVGGGGAIGIGF